MTKEEFLKTLDELYCHYEENSIWRNARLTDEIKIHLLEHIEENDLNFQVKIKDYKVEENVIFLYTDIGTFLLEKKEKDIPVLESLKNSSICFLDFFYKLDKEDLSSTFSMKVNALSFQRENDQNELLRYYLCYYYNYRNLSDTTMVHRLFKAYNDRCSINTIFSLESLEYPDFQDFCNLSLKALPNLKKLYDYSNKQRLNQNLVFSILILSEEDKMVESIKDHLEAFKKFTIEEVSKTSYLNPRFKLACEYLKKSELINLFRQEELLKMYQKNPYYYLFFPEVFQETIKHFENKSPMIYVDSTKEEKVHIRYLSHHLIEGVPLDYYIKYNRDKAEQRSFKNLFLKNNSSIAKLYTMYYKSYQNGWKEEGNLFDFIGYLFDTKIVTSLYQNPKISVDTIYDLEQFLPFYDKKIAQKVSMIKEELRKRNLTFYNALVSRQEDKEALRQTLLKFGLQEENIYPFLIQNKFLDRKRKEGLLTIVGRYFGNHLRVMDILVMIEEAENRNIPLNMVLEEKEISQKVFHKIYQQAEEKNPILYQCIDEHIEREKKKKIMKMIQFGYLVAEKEITSIEDYREKFPKAPSYYDLIKKLQSTELAPRLIEKASSFEDFDSSLIRKSLQKKL